MKILTFVAAFLGATLFTYTLSAQNQAQTVVSHYFEISDSTSSIQLNLKAPHTFIPWSGVQIMVRTEIALENGALEMLKDSIAVGRYKVLLTNNASNSDIKDVFTPFPKMKIGQRLIAEKLKYTVYVPEKFSIKNEKELVRIPSEPLADNRN
jgi:hypothetical protein